MVWRTLKTSETATSRRRALTRSMSNRSCGTLAEKFVNTPASSGRFRAASRNRSVTDAVASTPLPSRSSIMKSKPPVELSPWIGGGWRTATRASRICSVSRPWSSRARPAARELGRGPLLPLLEDHERGGGVGLVDRGDGVVAVEQQDVADAVELPGDLADAPGGPAGRLPGGAVGRLEDDDQVALVLGRDERLGALGDQPAGQRQQAERGEDDQPTSGGPRSRGTSRRSPRPTSGRG